MRWWKHKCPGYIGDNSVEQKFFLTARFSVIYMLNYCWRQPMKKLIFIVVLIVLVYPLKLTSVQLDPILINIKVNKEIIGKIPIINSRNVRTTAYNALESQTDSTPTICAWGDKIHEGVVAISRDLEKLGLIRNKKIYIEKKGNKIVKDRMHRRKRNQIDIFMESKKKAEKFGRQTLNIVWIKSHIEICKKTTTLTYLLDNIFIKVPYTEYKYLVAGKELTNDQLNNLNTIGELLYGKE